MQPEQDQNYWQPTDEATPEATLEQQPTAVDVPLPVAPSAPAPITWQASEFIHHEKNGMWFLAVLAVATVLLVVDYFLVKSWTFGALIVVMAFAAIVIGRRPPRTLNYTLSLQGIQIDEKLYSFHDYRAFGVVEEGALYSIRMIPNKRFMPMVGIYFPSEQGEQIVDMIGSVLAMEHIEQDTLDKLAEKIHF